MRSRAAASILETAGFDFVRSVAGGIKAWHGATAGGEPEAGMSFFPEAATQAELIGLAWILEEGSRKFYAATAGMVGVDEARGLFEDLMKAEEHHKTSLRDLYQEAAGTTAGPEFPVGTLRDQVDTDRMEGAVRISDALRWAAGRSLSEVLEFSVAREADSYDLYIKMSRRISGSSGKKVFDRLAVEEREHLNRMTSLLDQSRGA